MTGGGVQIPPLLPSIFSSCLKSSLYVKQEVLSVCVWLCVHAHKTGVTLCFLPKILTH